MTEEFKGAQFEKKPSGYILYDDKEVAHTLQCKHCGHSFISIKGSGIRRGFCHRCQGVLCGKETCMICVPFEAKLEWIEANGWIAEEQKTGEVMPSHGVKNEKKVAELLKLYPELIYFKALK